MPQILKKIEFHSWTQKLEVNVLQRPPLLREAVALAQVTRYAAEGLTLGVSRGSSSHCDLSCCSQKIRQYGGCSCRLTCKMWTGQKAIQLDGETLLCRLCPDIQEGRKQWSDTAMAGAEGLSTPAERGLNPHMIRFSELNFNFGKFKTNVITGKYCLVTFIWIVTL